MHKGLSVGIIHTSEKLVISDKYYRATRSVEAVEASGPSIFRDCPEVVRVRRCMWTRGEILSFSNGLRRLFFLVAGRHFPVRERACVRACVPARSPGL